MSASSQTLRTGASPTPYTIDAAGYWLERWRSEEISNERLLRARRNVERISREWIQLIRIERAAERANHAANQAKRSLIQLLVTVLILGVLAFGQGSVSTGSPVAVNGSGQPLPNVTVAVCTSNPGTSPAPCSFLAPLYTDITLAHVCSGIPASQPLNNQSNPTAGAGCSNPGLSDGQGNIVAFSTAGTYWCQYYGPNVATFVQPCIFPASGTGIAGGTRGMLQAQSPSGSFAGEAYIFADQFASTQAAINALPGTGGAVIFPASNLEYSCPSSIPSNVALIGLTSSWDLNIAGSFGLTIATNTQVKLGPCGSIAIPAGAQNIRLSSLTLDFNNSGNGFACVSCSGLQLSHVNIINAGNNSTPMFSLTSSGASGASNSVRNVIEHSSFNGNQSSAGANFASACVLLNGSASTAVTLNYFADIACTGSYKCGVQIEKEVDTNWWYGANFNPANTTANSAPVCINTLNPGSDQDSDANLFVGIQQTGAFTNHFRLGQSSGNVFWDADMNFANKVVLGGTPSISMLTAGLGAPGSNALMTGDATFSDSATSGSVSLGLDGGFTIARNATQFNLGNDWLLSNSGNANAYELVAINPAAPRIITWHDPGGNFGALFGLRYSTTMSTSALAANACRTETIAAAGASSSSVITWSFGNTPVGVTGWGDSPGISVKGLWGTANQVNISVCNNTSGSITPGAIGMLVTVTPTP